MAPELLLHGPSGLLSVLLFALLQVADAWTTHAIIQAGGYEANPLLQRLAAFLRRFTAARWAWLVIAKALALAAFVWLVVIEAIYLQALLAVIYLVVVIHNARTLRNIQS